MLRLAVLVEGFDGSLPFGALGVVELAEVKRLPLEHATPDADALDEAPVAMGLAVLEPLCRTKKHDGIVSYPTNVSKRVGLHYTDFSDAMSAY